MSSPDIHCNLPFCLVQSPAFPYSKSAENIAASHLSEPYD